MATDLFGTDSGSTVEATLIGGAVGALQAEVGCVIVQSRSMLVKPQVVKCAEAIAKLDDATLKKLEARMGTLHFMSNWGYLALHDRIPGVQFEMPQESLAV